MHKTLESIVKHVSKRVHLTLILACCVGLQSSQPLQICKITTTYFYENLIWVGFYIPSFTLKHLYITSGLGHCDACWYPATSARSSAIRWHANLIVIDRSHEPHCATYKLRCRHGPLYQQGLNLIPAWIKNRSSVNCVRNLLIHSQTSTAGPLKFGDG